MAPIDGLAMLVGPDLAPFLASGVSRSIRNGVEDQVRIEFPATNAISAFRVKQHAGRLYQLLLQHGRDADVAVYLDGVRL